MFRTASYLSACVVCGVLLVACDSDTTPGASGSGGGHSHDHPSEGPHHGQLIELGNEQYHGELLHDDATNTVTVYILDGSAKQLVPIPEPNVTIQLLIGGANTTYTLAAVADSGDVAQGASKFELVDPALCAALDDEHELKGRLQVTIGGTPFIGMFEHAEHDHDNGHEPDHDDEPGHDDDHDDDAGDHDHPEGDHDHGDDHDHPEGDTDN